MSSSSSPRRFQFNCPSVLPDAIFSAYHESYLPAGLARNGLEKA
jgi:hypothetical protein